jgi:hypothetical protein
LPAGPLIIEFHRDETGNQDHRVELSNEPFEHRSGSWTGVGVGLLKSGRSRTTVASGPSLGFAALKDLLMLLWPFVYSLSPPLFLLAPALELCALACELAAYVR